MNLIEKLGLKYPLIVAPMAGGPSSPELVAAVSQKGGLGSMGAAYSTPREIGDFTYNVRSLTNRPFGINLFIPAQLPAVPLEKIERAVQATEKFRIEMGLPLPALMPPYEENFDQQFEEVLRAKPRVFSFVFGVLASHYIKALHAENILVVGTATSSDEALQLAETGVDAIVAQGIEAGGHRGILNAEDIDPEIKTLDLVQTIKAQLQIPLIAAGGIMSVEDIRQMLKAGADAVQMGTAFLCVKEAGTSLPYRQALEGPERITKTTRAFSGRLARGVVNRFMREMDVQPENILPFPAQNKFTRDLRKAALAHRNSEFLSLWSGTGSGELWTGSASELIDNLFRGLESKGLGRS
ncbi:MAG: NAD(P)H-dependent flavin oxidoreductase [Pseudobdellovibrio sp.]